MNKEGVITTQKDKENLAFNIKLLRTYQRLTVADLADHALVGPDMIAKTENVKKEIIKMDDVIRIAAFFGVMTEDLIYKKAKIVFEDV